MPNCNVLIHLSSICCEEGRVKDGGAPWLASQTAAFCTPPAVAVMRRALRRTEQQPLSRNGGPSPGREASKAPAILQPALL